MANALTIGFNKALTWAGMRAAEATYRPGPYYLSGGILSASAGRYWNWWQTGYKLQPYGERNAMVEACVSAYSQTVAMCPPGHWQKQTNGGRKLVTTSALSRVMKRPNEYQSISDFLLNLTRRLYERGEAFAVAVRNERSEITALHLMREGKAHIGEEGSIFYQLNGNEVIDKRYDFSLPIPARDVLHVKLHTPRHVLKGESPILSAALDMAMSGAALSHQVAFYLNQARPSFTLETDAPLKQDQVKILRESWNDQTQGENAGNSPILTHGLKARPITTSAQDGQLAELLKMTDQAVALAMRIPLQILGIGGPTYASTELLMQDWIAKGLGFTLNHIEEAFGLLFALKGMPDEYLELDTRALLRSAYKEQIEGLSRGLTSGLYSPDEARETVDLPAVVDGHGSMPRMQQQQVPLSYGSDLQPPPPTPPPVLPPPEDDTSNGDEEEDDADDTERAVLAFRSVIENERRFAA